MATRFESSLPSNVTCRLGPHHRLDSTIHDGRRRFLTVLAAVLVGARAPAVHAAADAVTLELAAVERESGGRLGVAALHTGTGARLGYRANERFALCSTFKLMLVAAVLERVDAGELRLNQRLSYSHAELLYNSPTTQAHAGDGGLSLEALAQAAIELSDNTAANCLLRLIGGPVGLTRYLRRLGDRATRLDRNEPSLNCNFPDDPRDTTTPAAMIADLERVLVGRALADSSRERLLRWMRDCRTGDDRLRAGLPPGWTAGDKTGTGERGAVNDVAIFWHGGGAAVLVACYMTGSSRWMNELAALHARVASVIVRALA